MLKRTRHLVFSTGIGEKNLALVLAVASFLLLNALLVVDFRVDQLWTRVSVFFAIMSMGTSAEKEKFGNDWGQIPWWRIIGWVFLTMIPLVNAAPSIWASRNWAKEILQADA